MRSHLIAHVLIHQLKVPDGESEAMTLLVQDLREILHRIHDLIIAVAEMKVHEERYSPCW